MPSEYVIELENSSLNNQGTIVMFKCPHCKAKTISLFDKFNVLPSSKPKCSACGGHWCISAYFYYSAIFLAPFLFRVFVDYFEVSMLMAAITTLLIGFLAMCMQPLRKVVE